MKKTILILFASIICNFLKAQPVHFEWAKALGSTADDQGNSVAVDKSGNVYTTGYFSGRLDFDSGSDSFYLASNGGFDIFILKLDANGDFVWAKTIGGSADDLGNSICLDTAGNIIITGSFQGRVDFNPDTTRKFLNSLGRTDAFVAKFKSNGIFKWAKQLGGKSDDQANSVATAISGKIYATGYFSDTVLFNTGMSITRFVARGGTDIFVIKIDTNGTFVWMKAMSGTSNEAGNSITVDKSEIVYTTGYFLGLVDFNPGTATFNLTSFGDADIFVSKLDVNGNYVWAKQLGGKTKDVGNGIIIDASVNVITTGYFTGAADFDPGTAAVNLTSNGNSDIFISKLTTAGVYIWAKQIGSTGTDAGLSIATDANSSIYTSGGFQATTDFDPGSTSYTLTSAGGDDVFMSKLSSSGTFLWARNIGGGQNDMGYGIFVNTSKNVYTTGNYSLRSDFDPSKDSFNITSNGSLDIFVQKMAICSSSSFTIKASNCYSITINGETFTTSGMYYQTLVNKAGCDSNITLNITINTTTIGNLTVLACKSYTLNGTTYTSPGTYNQTLTNSAGCDSILVLELSFGESKSTITAIGCNTYTLNANTYFTSGTYTQTIQNKAGCDSVITLKLTIKKSTSSSVNITACNSYTLQTKTYTKSGVYIQTIKNYVDCDSVITLNLTINQSTSETLNKEACSSFTLNAQTYTKSGAYQQTLLNKKGCDSVITLNLLITNSAGTLTATACQSYLYHGQTYTASGVYTQIIPNAKGCDSSVTLNLTVNKVITTVTLFGGRLIADANDAAYQWLDCNKGMTPVPGAYYQDFTPKVTGDYAVKVTLNNCTDTSSCYNFKVGKVENYISTDIEIYPNPTAGEINLVLGNGINNGTLKLISITGQTLLIKSNLSGNKFILNLAEQANGIYFIEISEKGKVSRVRVAKN